MKWRPWLAAPIALALGGCDFAPRYAPPSVAVPSKFKDETAGGGTLPGHRRVVARLQGSNARRTASAGGRGQSHLAAAVAANDEAVARANAALSSAYPQIDAVPHLSGQQAVGQSPASVGQPADLLRRQSHRRANGLRDRHLGTGARYRGVGERDRRSKRRCARRRETRIARRARARLHQPARLR